MDRHPWLAAFWRLAFYTLRPTEPLRFRTRYYELWAVPDPYHLSRTVLRRGYWERFETEVFRSQLRCGMIVADIGANFGHYSLVAAREIGPEGLVLAFEPQADIYAELQRNVSLATGQAAIRTFSCAAGERDGTTTFVLNLRRAGCASRVLQNVNAMEVGTQIEVPMRRLACVLDEECPGRPLGLLKMDTQGGEAAVLEGAWEVIHRDHPVIIMEFWPRGLSRAGADPLAMLTRVTSLGYVLKLIDDRREQLCAVGPDFTAWPDYDGNDPNWQVNLLATSAAKAPDTAST